MRNLERQRGSVGESSACVALLCACVAFLASACGEGDSRPGRSAPGDELAPAHVEDVHAEDAHADEVTLTAAAIEAEGIALEPASLRVLHASIRVPARIAFNGERMAHVGSPVRGRVAELLASLGQEVGAGDALLVIDSPELGEAQSEFLQRKSATETAAPGVDLARNAYERGKALYDQNQGLPLTEVQRRETELRAAQAILRAAETAEQAARNRLVLLGMSSEAIERVSATGAIDPRYSVHAPLAGQVIEREVTLGELVGPDREALLVLADLSHLWILADVPDGRLSEVRAGAPARVLLGASEDHWCDGTVSFISPAVDSSTRTAQVRIEANDRHPELRPGVFAQAEIVVLEGHADDETPVLAVPESAIQRVEGASSVFVAVPGEPGTFARRAVLAGPAREGFVPIHSGLAEGEQVVVRGAFLLKAELGKGSAEHRH
jgi:membrane fusion protein, heavy metal efflux system